MINHTDMDAMQHKPRLIALTGLAGSGKTTAAEALMEQGWLRVKFADTLKRMVRAMGLTDEHIEGSLKEVPVDWLGGRTPRYLMQSIGTEWGRRMVHPDVWVSITRQRILEAQADGFDVVVDDCRFDNEAATVRDLGGRVVCIVGRGGIAGTHESEAGVVPDMSITNNESLRAFRARVVYILAQEEE